ncbi:MAG: metalloregulator ArsR/SmtB family transcription factor [Cyanobacteria bacterium P01_F01_bin.33]
MPGCEHKPIEPVALDATACDEAALIFSALGDANRLRILSLLLDGERCVSELASMLDDNLPAVSQRLRLLRSHRIVQSRRSGNHVYYALDDEHIRQLIQNSLEHAREL